MQSLLSRTLGTVVTLAIAACDPVHSLGARQTLSPPPTMECLESALHRSPVVAMATRVDEKVEQAFEVSIRDATVISRRRDASIRLETRRGAAPVLSMEYHWIGYETPDADQRRRMLSLASEVLEELVAACAPAATTKVECFGSRVGRGSVCNPG